MKIGIAEADIKTPIGMQMTGYGGRATGAIDVHDQLKLSSVYMESKGVKSLMIVCEILGFDPDFSRITEVKISNALNIPVSNIILTSIHTHAGPASGTLYGCGMAKQSWLDQIQKDIICLAKKSISKTFDGYFEYSAGECEIGMNRVLMAHNDPDYEDMIDKEVGVINIYESGSDKLRVVIVNHACHPVTLGNTNYSYSADFPYYMIKRINEEYGDDVAVIFTQGCCGDIDPRHRFSFEMTEKTGVMLGESVLASKREFKNDDIDIKCHSKELTVPLVPDYTIDGFKKVKQEALEECNKIIDANYKPSFKSLQAEAVKVTWADLCIKGYQSGDLLTEIHPMIKVWRLGDLNIVALPFETFHDLGFRIKEIFKNGKTMVMGYSNGVYGYLPYGELYDKSVYEIIAHRYYGYVGPVCREAGDIICNYLSEID